MSKSSQPASILGRKWAFEVVDELEDGESIRYGDLRARVGIPSDATLANRLAELNEAGLVTRESFDEIPPRVEYRLTDDGEDVREHMRALQNILGKGGSDAA